MPYLLQQHLGPLACWDVALLGFHQPFHSEEDVFMLKKLKQARAWTWTEDFAVSIRKCDAIVVTNVERKIEWVSSGFEKMTGYPIQELMGRNPRFLQEGNGPIPVRALSKFSIREDTSTFLEVYNYRKNGDRYLCRVHIFPLFDASQQLVNFIALESEVA